MAVIETELYVRWCSGFFRTIGTSCRETETHMASPVVAFGFR